MWFKQISLKKKKKEYKNLSIEIKILIAGALLSSFMALMGVSLLIIFGVNLLLLTNYYNALVTEDKKKKKILGEAGSPRGTTKK